MAKKKRDPIAEYCHDWVNWCRTRGMYLKHQGAGSLLGRLQPSRSGREPNARNQQDMTYFNMAVHMLADMPKWRRRAEAFLAYYVGDGEVAKRTADKLGVSRSTYYEHVDAFAKQAYSLMPGIKRSHEENFGAPRPAPAGAPDAHRPAPR